MSEPSDRLIAADLRVGLEGARIGNEIVVVEEARSTNDLAWQALERGTPEGYVVFAERQTAGRGQYGRHWESTPYKGLWLSILLRPGLSLEKSPQLTPQLARVVAGTITDQTGCVATIKPPNDIYIAGRKVAGILVEGRTENGGGYVAVAGIGINVSQTVDDFPEELRATATSLAMVTGRKVDRSKLAIALLLKMEAHFQQPE